MINDLTKNPSKFKPLWLPLTWSTREHLETNLACQKHRCQENLATTARADSCYMATSPFLGSISIKVFPLTAVKALLYRTARTYRIAHSHKILTMVYLVVIVLGFFKTFFFTQLMVQLATWLIHLEESENCFPQNSLICFISPEQSCHNTGSLWLKLEVKLKILLYRKVGIF